MAPTEQPPDKPRILIAHDWIKSWAGSERCVERMVGLYPGADLVVGFRDPAVTHEVALRARETWLARVPGVLSHYQWMLPLEWSAFATLDTSGYDLVISSSHALSKAVRPGRPGRHLCYCYSPPRYLWDRYQDYAARTSVVRRLALRTGLLPLRSLDRLGAAGVSHFVAISQFVAQRVERAYRRHARVVYPPVSRKPGGQEGSRENFLLHLGRLVPYKRIDLVIRAANTAGVRLVVAGDGPERARLERLAGPLTEFTGEVTEVEAGQLLSRCAGFVFAAVEDFGIAPLEACAHGAPVVAFNAGAARETLREGLTGVMFQEPTETALVEAIKRLLSRSWDEQAIRAHAGQFSPERFDQAFSKVVEAVLSGETW